MVHRCLPLLREEGAYSLVGHFLCCRRLKRHKSPQRLDCKLVWMTVGYATHSSNGWGGQPRSTFWPLWLHSFLVHFYPYIWHPIPTEREIWDGVISGAEKIGFEHFFGIFCFFAFFPPYLRRYWKSDATFTIKTFNFISGNAFFIYCRAINWAKSALFWFFALFWNQEKWISRVGRFPPYFHSHIVLDPFFWWFLAQSNTR